METSYITNNNYTAQKSSFYRVFIILILISVITKTAMLFNTSVYGTRCIFFDKYYLKNAGVFIRNTRGAKYFCFQGSLVSLPPGVKCIQYKQS